MSQSATSAFEERAVQLLSEFIGEQAQNTRQGGEASRDQGVDFEVRSGGRRFVVQMKKSGAAASVASAVEQLRRYVSALGDPHVIPLLVVPFMGEVGRAISEGAGVSWLDLSGNARITAPGLRVYVAGRPNQYKPRGRPNSAFAPKSSRVARQLLIAPDRAYSQRDLAKVAGLDEGFVSKIVRRLEADGLVVRTGEGAVRPRDPNVLLDAWREAYDFSRHRIIRGHAPARSSEYLTKQVAEALGRAGLSCAATGLAGAWLLTSFAAFRIVSFYVETEPRPETLKALGFREEGKGANLWLAVPNDEGVFTGAKERDGVRCAHPLQVYLDLKGHPERAAEAAQELRRKYLAW
jgi:DNA-binding Lrp family transcriptional regulator